jgi:hypothetical protein
MLAVGPTPSSARDPLVALGLRLAVLVGQASSPAVSVLCSHLLREILLA